MRYIFYKNRIKKLLPITIYYLILSNKQYHERRAPLTYSFQTSSFVITFLKKSKANDEIENIYNVKKKKQSEDDS